ncbi:hypothetical protein E2320_004714, partial [Naja naja]
MPGSCSEIKLRGRALCVSWLFWAVWGSLALAPACGYVIVNSVSWSVPNEVEEELDSSSNEEALPALLEDTSSIWKQSYPASVYKEEEIRTRPGTERSKQISSPSRMFSYRRESSKGADIPALPLEQAARTARFLMHRHGWGFLATISTQEKVPPPKTIVDPDDPRCARITFIGKMITVPPEELESVKQALFSRHPIMRKWPRNYEWFFMKMNIEHIWLQDWYGGITVITLEEYFKAVPSK